MARMASMGLKPITLSYVPEVWLLYAYPRRGRDGHHDYEIIQESMSQSWLHYSIILQ